MRARLRTWRVIRVRRHVVAHCGAHLSQSPQSLAHTVEHGPASQPARPYGHQPSIRGIGAASGRVCVARDGRQAMLRRRITHSGGKVVAAKNSHTHTSLYGSLETRKSRPSCKNDQLALENTRQTPRASHKPPERSDVKYEALSSGVSIVWRSTVYYPEIPDRHLMRPAR